MQNHGSQYPAPDDDFFVPTQRTAVSPVLSPPTAVSQTAPLKKAPMPPSRIDRAKSVSAVLATQAQKNSQPSVSQSTTPPPPLPARANSGSITSTQIQPQVANPSQASLPPATTPTQAAAPPLPSRSSRSQSTSTPPASTAPPTLPPRVVAAPVGPAPVTSVPVVVAAAPQILPQTPPSVPQESKVVEFPPAVPQNIAPQSPVASEVCDEPPGGSASATPRPYWRKYVETDGMSPQCLARLPNLDQLRNIAFPLVPSMFQNFQQVGERLFQGLQSDASKARIAFEWISRHIRFDEELWELNPDMGDPLVHPDVVIQRGTTTFAGFSNLFHALMSVAGVECVSIVGTTRVPGSARAKNCRSAWNAFRDSSGDWYLVDCGYLTAFSVFEKGSRTPPRIPDYFFATFPELFNQFNCPDQLHWQLCKDAEDVIEPADYAGLPLPLFETSVPFRFVKPWSGGFFQQDQRFEIHVECPRAPVLNTWRGSDCNQTMMRSTGRFRWTGSCLAAGNVSSFQVAFSTPTWETACAVHRSVQASPMMLDAYGPAGFYGEVDASLKAPLIADDYRVAICVRCQRGEIKFDRLDSVARNCPEFPSLEEVARYLAQSAPSELERARIIFTWIATHISYDWEAFCSGNLTEASTVDAVFARRSGVCSGYTLLYHQMATIVGVKTYCISGIAPGLCPNCPSAGHAWNAVLIEGEMFLLDSCWAAGGITNGKFNFSFTPFWFLTPPKQFVESHFPSNPIWQLLAEPWTKEQFSRKRPRLAVAAFPLGFQILAPTTATLKSFSITRIQYKFSNLPPGGALCYWAADERAPVGFLKERKIPASGQDVLDVKIEAPPGGKFYLGYISGNKSVPLATFGVE